MKNRCFCSVVSSSHLGGAIALAASLRASGNPEELHLLVTDITGGGELPSLPEGMVIHRLEEAATGMPPLMPYYFDEFELCNALKPYVVRHLFACGMREVVYLDTDIFPVSPFAPVWDALRQSPVILTPHNLEPPPLDLGYTTEIAVVDQGIYNGGFAAWRAGAEAGQVLDWMCSRFPVYAFNRRSQGMFVDQKLLPLLPIYFPDMVTIWREPSVNIAFWNVNERNVQLVDASYEINGRPVVFFHMSGYRLSVPDKACSYLGLEANRRILDGALWFRRVMDDYSSLLRSVPPPAPPKPYKFSHYRGLRLSPPLRTLLFEKEGQIRWSSWPVIKILFLDQLRLVKRWLLRCLHLNGS